MPAVRALALLCLLLASCSDAEARGRTGPKGSGPDRPRAPAPRPEEDKAGFGFTIQDARLAVDRGHAREALAFYERVAAGAEARGARDVAARASGLVAVVAIRVGMLQKAIGAGTRALELLGDEPRTADAIALALSLHNVVGRAYRQAGDAGQARRYLEEGVALGRAEALQRRATMLQVGSLSRRLAQLAFAEGDRATAHAMALETARLFETFVSRSGRREREQGTGGVRRHATEALLLLTRVQLALGRVEEADATLARAESHARLVGSPEVDLDVLSARAQAALARGAETSAVGLFRRAVTEAERLQKGHALIGLHHGMARALLALGRAPEALDSIRASLALVEEVRAELQEAELRSGFLEDRQGLYRLAVEIALQTGSAEEAFAFAERGRARAFLDLLGGRTRLSKARTAALVQEEVRLRERLAGARAAAEERDAEDTGPGGGRAQAEAAEREYRSFLERVRKENLEQASLMSVEPVTLAETQRLLPEGTVLLEYFVAGQHVVLWVVDRQRARALRLGVDRPTLVTEVREFRAAVAERAAAPRVEASARRLYAWLVEPARPEIHGSRVLVAPHDVLHYLPFAALRSPAGRWLIEDFTVATVPSASVLRYLAGKGAGGAGAPVLAVGNPDLGPALNLRYAAREARMVGQRHPASTVLMGGEATEARAKALLPGAGLAHFAVHGELNESDPLSSALLLVPGGGEDGRLEVREVFGLDLHARLVVLSACETGLGKLSRGDELVGLQRAFLYAGTPAVVTTLWRVDDRASYDLMREFHDRLGVAPPDEALRRAQRALLERLAHPFAWAGFVMTGAIP